jgi:hypothetical protein
MTKKRKKASDRIFYTAPRNWKVWQWAFTPAALVLFCLTVFLTIALQYAP